MVFFKLGASKVAFCGVLSVLSIAFFLSEEVAAQGGGTSNNGQTDVAVMAETDPFNAKSETLAPANPESGAKVELSRALEKQVLLPGKFTADPSAHVINDKLYVFASTDDPKENIEDPKETHFLMTRYTIMSFSEDLSKVTEHKEVLPLDSIPWAKKQLRAPDATCDGDKCFLYFPAKDNNDIFRLGAAVSSTGPEGPYTPEANYIQGTYSVDPAVFKDTDGSSYLFWGGEWGGQLEGWEDDSKFNASVQAPLTGKGLQPRVAKLKRNMVEIEEIRRVRVVDENGADIMMKDGDRKFFEAPWIHQGPLGKYYLSYSTGQTHLLVYATSDSLFGPFTHQGTIMTEPVGWTTHHSIVEYKGSTFLFYHDSQTSQKTNLRQVKFQRLSYDEDGAIGQVTP